MWLVFKLKNDNKFEWVKQALTVDKNLFLL